MGDPISTSRRGLITRTWAELTRARWGYARDLSGRLAHPPGENHARRCGRARCAGIASQQRAHARGTRRRPGRADRRLPHWSRALAGGLRAIRNRQNPPRVAGTAVLLRRADACVSAASAAWHLSGGG